MLVVLDQCVYEYLAVLEMTVVIAGTIDEEKIALQLRGEN